MTIQRTVAVALGCVLAIALAGCGRRVVVDPSEVARENDRQWTVSSEPSRVVTAQPVVNPQPTMAPAAPVPNAPPP